MPNRYFRLMLIFRIDIRPDPQGIAMLEMNVPLIGFKSKFNDFDWNLFIILQNNQKFFIVSFWFLCGKYAKRIIQYTFKFFKGYIYNFSIFTLFSNMQLLQSYKFLSRVITIGPDITNYFLEAKISYIDNFVPKFLIICWKITFQWILGQKFGLNKPYGLFSVFSAIWQVS